MVRKPLTRFPLIATLAVASLMSTGCTVPLEASLESRQEYVDTHNSSDEVAEAILAGRVIIGMTREEVEATWGVASETDTSEAYGMNLEWGKEVWYYRSISIFLTPEAEVYFNNGKVESVSPMY